MKITTDDIGNLCMTITEFTDKCDVHVKPIILLQFETIDEFQQARLALYQGMSPVDHGSITESQSRRSDTRINDKTVDFDMGFAVFRLFCSRQLYHPRLGALGAADAF